jgi:hypothetical protein
MAANKERDGDHSKTRFVSRLQSGSVAEIGWVTSLAAKFVTIAAAPR